MNLMINIAVSRAKAKTFIEAMAHQGFDANTKGRFTTFSKNGIFSPDYEVVMSLAGEAKSYCFISIRPQDPNPKE
jgi:hypothetical protein